MLNVELSRTRERPARFSSSTVEGKRLPIEMKGEIILILPKIPQSLHDEIVHDKSFARHGFNQQRVQGLLKAAETNVRSMESVGQG